MDDPIKGRCSLELPDLPELSDTEYLTEVLRLPAHKPELDFDNDLLTRAKAVGITATLPSADLNKRNTSSALSASTVATYQAGAFSAPSDGSASTNLTPHSSIFGPPSPGLDPADGNLSFAQYDKYLAQLDPNLDQPKIRKASVQGNSSRESIFSVSTRKSLSNVTASFKNRMRLKKRPARPFEPALSCVCCRDDFNKSTALHNLPCGHTYCASCLRVMVNHATTDESKMPPRCCIQPIPTVIVKNILDSDTQRTFLKAVAQFSTPWESRIFCPNTACAEFIPPRHKVDPKHPFSVTCRQCHTRVCVMCKSDAHPVGRDCPEDYELEAVLKMAEKSGWRRCYKCRNLVELAQGCVHVTCRCKAQFCYICGGVWDPTIGCPNICSGEEELERRRLEEEERAAEQEAAKADEEAAAAAEQAERVAAEKRSREHSAMEHLRTSQDQELHRFLAFMKTARSSMQTRHLVQKTAVMDRHTDQEEKMKERHNKTTTHLEDRQIAAELELQSSLDQSERSVNIRLRHMEAYCDGLGMHPNSDTTVPVRVVTERDLRELGKQYNLRDGMERVHQSKINVMRDRQAKRMEELVDRQEADFQKLVDKRQEDLEDIAAQFAHETDTVNAVFRSRQVKITARWKLATEVLCKELEEKDAVKYAVIPAPKWPADNNDARNGTLVEDLDE